MSLAAHHTLDGGKIRVSQGIGGCYLLLAPLLHWQILLYCGDMRWVFGIIETSARHRLYWTERWTNHQMDSDNCSNYGAYVWIFTHFFQDLWTPRHALLRRSIRPSNPPQRSMQQLNRQQGIEGKAVEEGWSKRYLLNRMRSLESRWWCDVVHNKEQYDSWEEIGWNTQGTSKLNNYLPSLKSKINEEPCNNLQIRREYPQKLSSTGGCRIPLRSTVLCPWGLSRHQIVSGQISSHVRSGKENRAI